MRLLILISTAASVLLSACSTAPTPGSTALPRQARPEDIAAADAFFSSSKSRGMVPASGPERPSLTRDQAGYVIELDQQRVYLYSGPQLVAFSKISSGRPNYRTETGEFLIGQRELNHRSNIYGDYVATGSGSMMVKDVTSGFDPKPPGARFQGSLMRYFQRFDKAGGGSTAMGFHAGVLPGSPASHGCVRLPESMAKWFFENVPAGVPVFINGEKNGVPLGTRQKPPKRSKKVHSSLKEPAAPKPESPPPASEAGTVPPSPPTPPAEGETPPPGGTLGPVPQGQ
ncbi:MAG: L,D-transpeptidase [Verrucomicrobiales bacterium]|nr:L,D-transpeptidase [Verrucomicrobiales bacterium]